MTKNAGNNVPQELTMTESTPVRYFPPVRLADAGPVDPETIEAHALALADQRVRGLAMQLKVKLRSLVELASFYSVMSQAAEGALVDGITAEAWLEQRLRELDAEIDVTKGEHAAMDQRLKARTTRRQPLLNAVSVRLTSHERELEVLSNRLSLAKQQAAEGGNQFQKLIDAGLSREQIAKLGDVEDPVDKQARDIARMEARIAELRSETPKLKAFADDLRHDPAHLDGLDGLDQLIAAAQPVPETGEREA